MSGMRVYIRCENEIARIEQIRHAHDKAYQGGDMVLARPHSSILDKPAAYTKEMIHAQQSKAPMYYICKRDLPTRLPGSAISAASHRERPAQIAMKKRTISFPSHARARGNRPHESRISGLRPTRQMCLPKLFLPIVPANPSFVHLHASRKHGQRDVFSSRGCCPPTGAQPPE